MAKHDEQSQTEPTLPHYVLGMKAGAAHKHLIEAGYRKQVWVSHRQPIEPAEQPPFPGDIVAFQAPYPRMSGGPPPHDTRLFLVTVQSVEVPQLEPVGQPSPGNAGVRLNVAYVMCENEGLNLVHSGGPSGSAAHVINQSPDPGTEAAPGSNVYVITWIPR